MRKQTAILAAQQGLPSLQIDSQHLPSGISVGVTTMPQKVDTAHIVETAKRLAAAPSAAAAPQSYNHRPRPFALAPPFAKGETAASPGGNPSFHSTTASSQGGGSMPAGYTFPAGTTMNPALTAKWQQHAFAQASRVKAFQAAQEQARRVAFMRTQQTQQGRGEPSPLVASSSQAEGATGSPSPQGLMMGTQDTQIQARVRAVMQQQAAIMQQQQLQAQALQQQQAQLAVAAQHIGETQGFHAASSQALTVAISPAPAQPGASIPSSNSGAGAILPAMAGSTPLQEGATAAGLGTAMPFPDGPDTITITVRAPNEVANNHQGTNSAPSVPLVPSQGDIAPDNEDGGIFDDAEE